MASDEITVRQATPNEINEYVLSAWLNSYALGLIGKLMRADARYGVGREKYWSEERGKIERILSTSSVSVRIAEYDGEPVGWICLDDTRRTIHYVFVNKNFRKQGVAKSLLPAWFSDAEGGPVYLTHLPPPWYSRPNQDPNGRPPPWRGHVVINLIGMG